jgi:hypothetical protein
VGAAEDVKDASAGAASDVKKAAVDAKDTAADKAKEPKPPARPVSEIRADIEKERAELSRSFDALRADLDEAVDVGRQRAADTGKKAKIVGPVVAGVVTSLVIARMLYKRRARTGD